MKLSKRILQSSTVQKLLCYLGSLYIRFVYLTTRWTVIGGDIPKKFWDEDKLFVFSFWHGRLLMLPSIWSRDKTIHIMTSLHKDGRIIADVVGHFGVKTIAGSTSKGGSTALRNMLRTVKSGEYVGITPDGPRGPRMRAQEGVVAVGRLAKVPIIPISYSCSRVKLLNSWDRFMVPKPFGRGVVIWGEPIVVPHTSNKEKLEETRAKVEDAMIALNREADRLCGLDPIQPAEPAIEETSS